MTKIAIIGAGMSGLTAAHLLKDHAQVTLFDKSRGVGGRLSTRRADPYHFDHGAQYFTARTAAFQQFLKPMIQDNIIAPWPARYVKFDGCQQVLQANWAKDEPRYVAVPGMNQMAKHLAKDLNVKTSAHIDSIKRQEHWCLTCADGQVVSDVDWVISTLPPAQAADLLPQNFAHYTTLQTTKMQACFALMLGFTHELPIEFDAAHLVNSDISWLSLNSRKPGRAEHHALIVHSSAAYAEQNYDAPREQVADHMLALTSDILHYDVRLADHQALHGWKYANNAQRKHAPILLDQDQKLAACGDWCLGGRVEGAFTSAYTLVDTLLKRGL